MTVSPEERQRIYDQLRDAINTRDLSNSEKFDKAILTYSSSGLALSLAFLKDIRTPADVLYGWLLYGSWVCFVLAIITVIVSYPLSQRGLAKQLALGHRYYIEGDDDAFNLKNRYVRWVEYVSIAAGVLFISAVVLSTVFVFTNVRDMNMNDTKKTPSPISVQSHAMDAAHIPNMQQLREGARIPPMQQLQGGANIPPLTQRGAGIPPLQALPQQATPVVVTTTPSTSQVVSPPVAPVAMPKNTKTGE